MKRRRQPVASSKQVSEFMSRQRRTGTAPELALRRALHARGVRFRLQGPRLPGKPDVILIRPKLAIFVDGCFWHRCPLHFTQPHANRAWWTVKLASNVARDRLVDEALGELGWEAVRIWEHEDPIAVAERLAKRFFAS